MMTAAHLLCAVMALGLLVQVVDVPGHVDGGHQQEQRVAQDGQSDCVHVLDETVRLFHGPDG